MTVGKPLVVGQIALTFHTAAAAVVTALLRELGQQIDLKEAPHEDMYAMQQAGEVDLLISAWLPDSHGKYIAPYEDALLKLAVIYNPYCVWGIPDTAPADIQSVADLARPEVAALFNKRIQGIGPGAGISRFSRQMVDDYGLAGQGFHFENGSLSDCTDTYLAAVGRGEMAIVPLWHPQWLHRVTGLRALNDPLGLLGGQDDATLVLRKDAQAKLVPGALGLLHSVQLGNEVVSELDQAICRERMTPDAAADRWIAANRQICDGWLR